MGVRVSSDALRQVFLNALQTAQRQVLETQNQVSTGLRVNQPSDDPIGSARIRELEASLSRLDQYQTNGVIARNRLVLEEEALVGVIANLQRIRELTVQANNATQGVESRRAIAAELRERLDGLISVANSADSAGRYLFAGFAENTQPFVRSGGNVAYNGDQGQRSLQVSDTRLVAVNDPGSEIFQRIPNGNGTFVLAAAQTNTGTGVLGAGTVVDGTAYVPDTYTITFLTAADYEVRDSGGALVVAGTYTQGDTIGFLGTETQLDGQPAAGDVFTSTASTSQDVFATVQNLITALESGANTSGSLALVHTQLGQALVDVDQALGRAMEVRSDVGSRVRSLEGEAELNEGFTVQLTATLSALRDLDYAEALSRLGQQLLGLEAAQQTFVRVQGLSLFRFL